MSEPLIHPASCEEVRHQVIEARAAGRRLRVRGSGHSVDAAIAPPDATVLLLDRLADVSITPAPGGGSARVEAGAGCHLGYHRYDPSGRSSWERSLTEQLDRAGFALDSLGGISHQTVSGFLMTGSAGGSLVHDAGANVAALELVDGRGKVHHLSRDAADPTERAMFEAAGVSMGLLGVVTRVWLDAVPAYDVVGREVTRPLASSRVDLLGREPGRGGLRELFQRHDYARALWWPQRGFDRLQVWTGDRAPRGPEGELAPFEILGRWDTLLGSLLQTLVGNVDDPSRVLAQLDAMDWFSHLERALGAVTRGDVLHRPSTEPPMRGLSARRAASVARKARAVIERAIDNRAVRAFCASVGHRMPAWVGELTSWFVPDGEKAFRDRWHHALPMDNQLDDRLWPTQFAEAWIPIERANEAMRVVEQVIRAEGDAQQEYALNRAFPLELYPGPASRFWLSPGFGGAALRVNPCRFLQWRGEPDDGAFQRLLDALRPFDPRPHWGKHLPRNDEAWQRALRRQLPRLDDFLRLREQLDPDGVFLTDYWRRHLGLRTAELMARSEVA